jgi:hypothetical protein
MTEKLRAFPLPSGNVWITLKVRRNNFLLPWIPYNFLFHATTNEQVPAEIVGTTGRKSTDVQRIQTYNRITAGPINYRIYSGPL